jgi:hypothetical protein
MNEKYPLCDITCMFACSLENRHIVYDFELHNRKLQLEIERSLVVERFHCEVNEVNICSLPG